MSKTTTVTSTSELPPFPSDIPTAPIATASLAKILASDEKEASKILEACRTDGFFYLDLRDDLSGRALLSESEQLLSLARDVFDIPIEEKRKYAIIKGQSLMGYKSVGTIKANDPLQRPDTTEFFGISKDHLYGFAPSRSYPTPVSEAKPLLKSFTKGSHDCCMSILTVLARKLGLQPDALVKPNTFTLESEDHVRLTKKEPHDEKSNSIGLISHTDFGTITLLFNWLGGLQIQSRDPTKQGQWEFVKPMAGHAIINLGDAAVKFTNGTLKSARHRVVNAPGQQGTVDRYSVVYFVRPNNDALMKPLDGIESNGLSKVDRLFYAEEDRVYTALEWNQQRQRAVGN